MSHETSEYWNPLVPELTVADIKASLRFYLAAGFTIRFRRSDPEFAYLELGQAQLMLQEEHGSGWATAPLERPLGRGINFQVEVPSAADAESSLRTAGYILFREPKETWYTVSAGREEGQIEFLLHDPDGYLMRFVEVL